MITLVQRHYRDVTLLADGGGEGLSSELGESWNTENLDGGSQPLTGARSKNRIRHGIEALSLTRVLVII